MWSCCSTQHLPARRGSDGASGRCVRSKYCVSPVCVVLCCLCVVGEQCSGGANPRPAHHLASAPSLPLANARGEITTVTQRCDGKVHKSNISLDGTGTRLMMDSTDGCVCCPNEIHTVVNITEITVRHHCFNAEPPHSLQPHPHPSRPSSCPEVGPCTDLQSAMPRAAFGAVVDADRMAPPHW